MPLSLNNFQISPDRTNYFVLQLTLTMVPKLFNSSSVLFNPLLSLLAICNFEEDPFSDCYKIWNPHQNSQYKSKFIPCVIKATFVISCTNKIFSFHIFSTIPSDLLFQFKPDIILNHHQEISGRAAEVAEAEEISPGFPHAQLLVHNICKPPQGNLIKRAFVRTGYFIYCITFQNYKKLI